MYSNLEDAQAEINSRWNDQALRSEVESYLSEIPAAFTAEPRAVLFRNIISSTTELIQFLKHAKELNLKHLGAEYLDDKFCTRNSDKLRLVKMGLIKGRDRNGDVMYVNKTVAPIEENDNKAFATIMTFDGEPLVDFHHRLIEQYGLGTIETLDMSSWLEANGGGRATDYYRKFLALFVCHGVLFETFVTTEPESEFTAQVVRPAFDWVVSHFGVRPLIVQNLPTEDYRYWLSYPCGVLKMPGDSNSP